MNKLIYDCIIIGSGPAALTAAIYMKRAGYLINVITGQDVGGILPKISVIENYPGFNSISGYDLSTKFIEQCEKLNTELTYYTNIKSIHAIGIQENEKNISESDMMYNIYALYTDNNENTTDYKSADYYSKSIIIATGTIPRSLDLPEESKYFNKGIHFCATCDGTFYKNKDVMVIGGGNSAFDAALYLSNICKSVTIVHRRDTFKAEQAMIDKCKNKINIKYLINTTIQHIYGEKRVESVELLSNNNLIKYKIDGIFYELGSIKNYPEIYELNKNSKIFNAGDCSLDNKYHQIIIACGDGAKTAINCIESLK